MKLILDKNVIGINSVTKQERTLAYAGDTAIILLKNPTYYICSLENDETNLYFPVFESQIRTIVPEVEDVLEEQDPYDIPIEYPL